MYVSVYRAREDVSVVIQTHPTYSSAFGVVEMGLPAVSEDFAQNVGDRVTLALPYEPPGPPELGEAAATCIGTRNALLLPRHGPLSVGPNMKPAKHNKTYLGVQP